jgi:hypothetical protein
MQAMVTHRPSQPHGTGLAQAGIRVGCMPVLVTQRTHTPYPLLSLLRDSTLLREQIADGQPGTPLALGLRLLSPSDGWQPIARAAVYCWHGPCHGVQVTSLDGHVRFRTVYPTAAADGIARLKLQIFTTRAMHVSGVALADIELPPDPVAAPSPTLPAEEAGGTRLRLRHLAGNACEGFTGLLTFGVSG